MCNDIYFDVDYSTACIAETPNSSADNTELQETDDSSELADG